LALASQTAPITLRDRGGTFDFMARTGHDTFGHHCCHPQSPCETCEFTMTIHTPGLLTPEEFASLIDVAVTSPDASIPANHLAKLIALGYLAMTAKGPVVTGDGLIRITESE
jgi:hypothetical protein